MDSNDEYAFICYLGVQRSFDTVATSRIYVLLDKNRRRPYAKTDDRPNSKLSLAVLDVDGKTLTRCHVLFTAATKDEVQTELNLAKAQGTRLTVPPRKSIGDVKIPVDDYDLLEERESAKNKVKQKNVAKQVEKERKSEQIKVKGLKSKPKHTSTPLKIIVTNRAKGSEAKRTLERTNKDKFLKDKAPQDKHDQEMVFSSVIKPAAPKVTAMEDPMTTKENVKAGEKGQPEQPCNLHWASTVVLGKDDTVASTNKKDDKGCAGVQDALQTLPNVNGNVKGSGGDLENLSSKPIKDQTAPPKISVSRVAIFSELTTKIQELNRKFDEKAEKDQKCFNEIISSLKDLSLKVSAPSNDESKRKSPRCAISELESLVSNRPISPVPPEMVYIGSGNYITKREMVAAEKEKSYRGRLTQVVALVLKHPERYNLTGGAGMEKVTDEHLEAIHGFLNVLKWKRINVNPIKVGQRVLQPLSDEFVRRTVSKYLSEIATKSNDNEHRVKKKKRNLKDDGASKKTRNKDMNDSASKKKGNEEINDDASKKEGDKDEDKEEDDDDDDDMAIRKKRKLNYDDTLSDGTELEDMSSFSISESGIVS